MPPIDAGIRIGTAGWSIPRASAVRFEAGGTHLQRYAKQMNCCEINSSFHRPHAVSTYAKWRDSTPSEFRFAVKVPRTITHELKLRDAREPLLAFLDQSSGLGAKRGPLLMQLPPSLGFDIALVDPFLRLLRSVHDGAVVCEPRHGTWFTAESDALLERYRISRVAADPPPAPGASSPSAWPGVSYYRLHGSPRMYWSRYDEAFVCSLAGAVRNATGAGEVWCIFDNTAGGAAMENAWELSEQLRQVPEPNQACNA